MVLVGLEWANIRAGQAWAGDRPPGLDDPTYQTLRAAVIYGSCFAGWALYTWGALLVHLRRSLTTRRMLWLIGLFLLAWLLFVADPGRRFEWWLD